MKNRKQTRHLSMATRRKISNSLRGRTLTRTHRKHISEALRGVYRFEPAGMLATR